MALEIELTRQFKNGLEKAKYVYEELLGLDNLPRFAYLQDVPGCFPYHTEGNALVHTDLVFNAMRKFLCDNHINDSRELTLLRAAMLHDIGKINTFRFNEEKQTYEYPNHSKVGSQMLDDFYDSTHVDYPAVKWLIENHIKPLFPNFEKKLTPVPQGFENVCNVGTISLLALCDITGSIHDESVNESQKVLKEHLEDLINKNL